MIDAAVDAAVRQAERALYDTMIAKDLDALAGLLSKDLAYVHSTGVVETKAEYLAAVDRSLYAYKKIESRRPVIVHYGETAIMHGIVDMWVATDGGPVEQLCLRFVLVWVREDGRWRLMLRQTTRLPG